MFLYDNYYIRDFLKKIKNISVNARVEKLIEESTSIDSIRDYHTFKDFVIKNIKQKQVNGFLMKSEFGAESLHYGHRKAFFDYAGVATDRERYIIPSFEHGADLRERGVESAKEYVNHSFVLQSTYKNEFLHGIRPYSPVYNIGPYILYAKPYYKKEIFNKLKKENGKTTLLFPAHTYEGASVSFDEQKFVDDVMGKFKKDYDTILISVYWNDVDNSMYDRFEAAGAKLVSAGFREDPNFIVRLRAIIELADVVASNMAGSYIGYSMALDKPFYMFNDRATLHDDAHIGTEKEEQKYSETIDKIFDTFSTLNPSSEQKNRQQEIFEYFWGGKELFKTREEARNIISLSDKLVKSCRGTTEGFEVIVKRTVEGLNPAKLTNGEMIELKKSLGILPNSEKG